MSDVIKKSKFSHDGGRDARGRNNVRDWARRLLTVIRQKFLRKRGIPDQMALRIAELEQQVAELSDAHAALTISEARFRNIINDQVELVCRYDANLDLTFVNAAYSRNHASTPEQLVGSNILNLISPEDRQRALNHVNTLTPQNPIAVSEHQTLMPDGTRRWFQWTDHALLDERGNIVEYQGVGRDISERRRIEEMQQKQRHITEALHESLEALTSSLDVETVMNKILEQASRVFVYDAASITQFEGDLAIVRYNRGFSPEILATLTTFLNSLPSNAYFANIRKGNPYLVSDTRTAPGWTALPELEWIRSSLGVPIRIRDEIIGVLSLDSQRIGNYSAADIEPMKTFAGYAGLALENAYHAANLEQKVIDRTSELTREKERVEAILNNSVDGILLANTEMTIEQENGVFSRMFACDPAAYIGKSLLDLVVPDHADKFKQLIAETAAHNAAKTIEAIARRRDGTRFDAELSIGYTGANDSSHHGIVCTIHDISPLKERERQLRFHASFQENVTDAVIATSLDFRVQSWNHAAEHIFGWKASEVIGRRIDDVLTLDAELLQTMRRDLHEQGRWNGEVMQQRRDGRSIYVQVSLVIFRDEYGQPLGVVSVNRDVTVRVRAEQALRESEQRFRLLLESAPIAIITSDSQGIVTLANKQAQRLFGYDAAELIGQYVEVLVPESQRSKHIGNRAEYIANPHHRPMGNEQLVYAARKDGTLFPAQIELSHIDTNSGILVMSFVVDITERLRAAAALEQQRVFLRRVIDVSPSMIYVKDFEGRYVLVNPMVADLYAMSPDALIGKSYGDLNPDAADINTVIEADRRVIAAEETIYLEESVNGPNGEVHWFQTTKVPIIGEDGSSRYVLGVSTEITGRRQAEEALRQALAKETELGELKSRFVSIASHEFRTPLASILAATESLSAYRQNMTGNQVEQRLEKIREQINHLTDIMDDVLHLARIQARRVQFNPAELDIDALCRDILEEFQSQQDFHHTVVYTCQPDIPTPRLDKKLMRQVITNLVSNAIKYSQDIKPVRVTLSYAAPMLRLEVKDEGIGVPEADMKHLFEPFHRGQNVGTISGTGLGLAIIWESVSLHGGSIDVQSEIGQGATFTVSIPIMARQEE